VAWLSPVTHQPGGPRTGTSEWRVVLAGGNRFEYIVLSLVDLEWREPAGTARCCIKSVKSVFRERARRAGALRGGL
jgi:hypothetical protein